jgi:hypothetical protein
MLLRWMFLFSTSLLAPSMPVCAPCLAQVPHRPRRRAVSSLAGGVAYSLFEPAGLPLDTCPCCLASDPLLRLGVTPSFRPLLTLPTRANSLSSGRARQIRRLAEAPSTQVECLYSPSLLSHSRTCHSEHFRVGSSCRHVGSALRVYRGVSMVGASMRADGSQVNTYSVCICV